MSHAALKARRPAGGRPTRAQAVLREARTLDVASAMFLGQGFDGTSIDSIALAAAVGKPSLYARYGDKKGLFLAVLRRMIERWVKPFADLSTIPERASDPAQLEQILVGFGRQVLDACLAPESVALGRILVSEATRFPELANTLHQEGWMRGLGHIAALLGRSVDFSRSEVKDPELAADLFLSLVLGRLSRQALLGIPIDPSTLDARVSAAVKIFLGSGLVLR